jgi:hypothetical protein
MPGAKNGHVKKSALTQLLMKATGEAEAKRDVMGNHRVLARLLQHLQHDTPERAQLLEAAGIKGSISSKLCTKLADNLFHKIEDDYPGRSIAQKLDEYETTTEGINMVRLSEVQREKVNWLWRDHIPLGKLVILTGDPEVGKTWLVCYLMAVLTSGQSMPDLSYAYGGRCNCLFATAEDGLADTIRPRFDLMGGDPSRVHCLTCVVEKPVNGMAPRKAFLELDRHMELLESYLQKHPLIRFVALDPLAAFLGRVDAHKNSQVRGVLGPLARLAEKYGPTIIGINHLHKGEGSALYRGMGSIAFNAAARIVWQITKDRKDPELRNFLCVKTNLVRKPKGAAFRISPTGLSWEELTQPLTADEALNGGSGKRDKAKELLQELLKDGPVLEKDVKTKAKELGLGDRTVDTAKKELGVRSVRVEGSWKWAL